MQITIRPARLDDVGPIAELICSAAPELYTYLYQHQAVDFVRYQFEVGAGISGWPNVTVAVINDKEVVATGCFYDREKNERLRSQTPQSVSSFFNEADAAAIMTRFKSIAGYIQPLREGELYLANFGVAEHWRGRGIGSQMLLQQIERARAADYTAFGLDVSVSNPRAQALYARMGLQVVGENEFPLPSAGVPGSRKMELLL